MVAWKLAPDTELKFHHHVDSEMYVVVEGEIVTWTESLEVVLRSGEASLTVAGESHGVRNDGVDEARIVIVGHRPAVGRPLGEPA